MLRARTTKGKTVELPTDLAFIEVLDVDAALGALFVIDPSNPKHVTFFTTSESELINYAKLNKLKVSSIVTLRRGH